MTNEEAFKLGQAFSRLCPYASGDGRDIGRVVDQLAEIAEGWPEFSQLPDEIQGHYWNQYARGGDALVELRHMIIQWLRSNK